MVTFAPAGSLVTTKFEEAVPAVRGLGATGLARGAVLMLLRAWGSGFTALMSSAGASGRAIGCSGTGSGVGVGAGPGGSRDTLTIGAASLRGTGADVLPHSHIVASVTNTDVQPAMATTVAAPSCVFAPGDGDRLRHGLQAMRIWETATAAPAAA